MSARAILLVLMQPPPAFEEEFNCWYDTEHIPERLAVPGFTAARRYACLLGWPRYMALYDLANLEVLDSAAYLRVSGARFSPWTRRVLSRVRVDRMVAAQLYPGDAPTTDCARTLLLRFAASGASMGASMGASTGAPDETDLAARLRAGFEGKDDVADLRLFASPAGTRSAYLALIGLASPAIEARIDRAVLGPWAARLELANVYARY